MSVKDEVIQMLEKLEDGGWKLEHVHIDEQQTTQLPGAEKVMTVYVTLPVELAFTAPEAEES